MRITIRFLDGACTLAEVTATPGPIERLLFRDRPTVAVAARTIAGDSWAWDRTGRMVPVHIADEIRTARRQDGARP